MERNSLMLMYRFSNFLYKKRLRTLARIVSRMIRLIFACELPASVSIGKGTLFVHNGLGVVVHPKCVIGENCRIYQNVTLGGRHERGYPVICDQVFIGAGACVLGGIRIGSEAKIGANSVVLKDVDDNSIIVGIPGKDIRKL